MGQKNKQMRGRRDIVARLRGLEALPDRGIIHYAWIAALRWVLYWDDSLDTF